MRIRDGLTCMAVAGLLAAAGVAASCGRHGTPANNPEPEVDAVAQVGDSVLSVIDVVRRIPSGMAEADSVELFNAIVDGWLECMLLDELGSENIEDMAEIDRMTEKYRKKLIVASYRRNLRASHRWSIPEDSIRNYYKSHARELTLDRPVVKGLYVKLPSDASRLPDIKRWMMTATPDAIDNLERYGLTDAIEYSFFEDKWTDWNVISRQIPFRFDDPDRFAATKVNFETSYGGMTYLLHISDYILSGEIMPYEVAAPRIAERLEAESGEKYERSLISDLYSKARKEGRLHDYRRREKSPGAVNKTDKTDSITYRKSTNEKR